MESKRIKSAWEIALERAERLGSLSTEELRAREKEESREIGRALAARWLSGLPARDLRSELSKRDAARRTTVLDQAVASLVDSLSLRPDEKALRALEGLRLLVGADAFQPLEDRVSSLWRQYQETASRELAQWERRIGDARAPELRTRGLSGSSLRLNVEASPAWQVAMEQLDATYRDRLADIGRHIRKLTAQAPR